MVCCEQNIRAGLSESKKKTYTHNVALQKKKKIIRWGR